MTVNADYHIFKATEQRNQLMKNQNLANLIYDLRTGMNMPEGRVKYRQLKNFFDVVGKEDFKGKTLRTHPYGETTGYELVYYDPILSQLVEITASLSELSQMVEIKIPKIRTILAGFAGIVVFAKSNLTAKWGNRTRGHEAMEEFFDRAKHLDNLVGGIFSSVAKGIMERPKPVVRSFAYSDADHECHIVVGITSDRESHEFNDFRFSFYQAA